MAEVGSPSCHGLETEVLKDTLADDDEDFRLGPST